MICLVLWGDITAENSHRKLGWPQNLGPKTSFLTQKKDVSGKGFGPEKTRFFDEKMRFFDEKTRFFEKKALFFPRKNTPIFGFFLKTSKKRGAEQSSRVGAPNIAAKKRVFGILFPVLFFQKVKNEKNHPKNSVFSKMTYSRVNKMGHFFRIFQKNPVKTWIEFTFLTIFTTTDIIFIVAFIMIILTYDLSCVMRWYYSREFP